MNKVFFILMLFNLGLGSCLEFKRKDEKEQIPETKPAGSPPIPQLGPPQNQAPAGFSIQGSVTAVLNLVFPAAHAIVPECESRCQHPQACLKVYRVVNSQRELICEAHINANGSYDLRFSQNPQQLQNSPLVFESNRNNNIRKRTTFFRPASESKIFLDLNTETTRMSDGLLDQLKEMMANNVSPQTIESFVGSNQSLPVVCTPNKVETLDCRNEILGSAVATKQTTCNELGTLNSTTRQCQASVCAFGFFLNNGQCESQVCVPGQTQFVQCQNSIDGAQFAHAARTCRNDGSGFSEAGACQLLNCSAGHRQMGNTCIRIVCGQGTTDRQDCSNEMANSAAAHRERHCLPGGTAWGEFSQCMVTQCQAGYQRIGNSCQRVQICQPGATRTVSCLNEITNSSHAMKVEVCSQDGYQYEDQSSCSVSECIQGYGVNNNSCLEWMCRPNQVNQVGCAQDPDAPANSFQSMKQRICAEDGLSFGDWSACQALNCLSGYELLEGRCVPIALPQEPIEQSIEQLQAAVESAQALLTQKTQEAQALALQEQAILTDVNQANSLASMAVENLQAMIDEGASAEQISEAQEQATLAAQQATVKAIQLGEVQSQLTLAQAEEAAASAAFELAAQVLAEALGAVEEQQPNNNGGSEEEQQTNNNNGGSEEEQQTNNNNGGSEEEQQTNNNGGSEEEQQTNNNNGGHEGPIVETPVQQPLPQEAWGVLDTSFGGNGVSSNVPFGSNGDVYSSMTNLNMAVSPNGIINIIGYYSRNSTSGTRLLRVRADGTFVKMSSILNFPRPPLEFEIAGVNIFSSRHEATPTAIRVQPNGKILIGGYVHTSITAKYPNSNVNFPPQASCSLIKTCSETFMCRATGAIKSFTHRYYDCGQNDWGYLNVSEPQGDCLFGDSPNNYTREIQYKTSHGQYYPPTTNPRDCRLAHNSFDTTVRGKTESQVFQHLFVARLNANGTFDTSFNNGGVFYYARSKRQAPIIPNYAYQALNREHVSNIDITSDRKILVSGIHLRSLKGSANSLTEVYQPILLKLTENGSYDLNFANGGLKIFAESDDEVSGITYAIQTQGAIYALKHIYMVNTPQGVQTILYKMNAQTGDWIEEFGEGGMFKVINNETRMYRWLDYQGFGTHKFEVALSRNLANDGVHLAGFYNPINIFSLSLNDTENINREQIEAKLINYPHQISFPVGPYINYFSDVKVFNNGRFVIGTYSRKISPVASTRELHGFSPDQVDSPSTLFGSNGKTVLSNNGQGNHNYPSAVNNQEIYYLYWPNFNNPTLRVKKLR